METPIESINQPESVKSKMEKDVVSFIRQESLTSQETFKAYQLALGLELNEVGESILREEVFQLARLLEDYINKGAPLNTVAEIIESRGKFERLEEIYHEAVNRLMVTDGEKKTLHSIVKDVRPGELMVLDAKSKEELADMKIPSYLEPNDQNRRLLAASLLDMLEKLQGVKIEVMFTS
jgi:hypothetical protein